MLALRLPSRMLRPPARPVASASRCVLQVRRIGARSSNATPNAILNEQLVAENPIAQQLLDTGLWKPKFRSEESAAAAAAKKSKPRARKGVTGDKSRVNIAGEGLCDDIISYVGAGLERHRGCDLIDLYPGTGVWSRKLNDFLQPRSHILLEPDEKLYQPFLQPLLDRPGTVLVPKSGIMWKELETVLTPEFLPHQKVREGDERWERNDTLLVTANLASHPRKRFNSFDSLAKLVHHQLVESIRTSTLFQRYGQVRMLIWSRTDDTGSLLPPQIQKRKKSAIATELYCEWVREVCTVAANDTSFFGRDYSIDLYLGAKILKQMSEAGMKVPPGRETQMYTEVKQALDEGAAFDLPGTKTPIYKRAFTEELEGLEALKASGKMQKHTAESNTLSNHRYRLKSEQKRSEQMLELSLSLDAAQEKIAALEAAGKSSTNVAQSFVAEWEIQMRSGLRAIPTIFIPYRHNLHIARQNPPVLHRDRRVYEPLAIRKSDFFPQVECNLIDFQPKPVHQVFRGSGAESNRAGHVMELITGFMMMSSGHSVDRVLNSMWPGAAEYIMPRWKSARDPAQGGVPDIPSKLAQLTPRLLNARQWEELLELWMEWPFRPEFSELIARFHEAEVEDEDAGPET
ncbi:mitochondrial transcription factor 1 [Microdochium nivale]|nr:mitochondrial transcription factor 1 [Microdochium nivale]